MAYGKIYWQEFFLGGVSRDFSKDKLSEISLNGTVYDFSIDRSTTAKEDILNIQKYQLNENDID